jgi:IS1 family transposase
VVIRLETRQQTLDLDRFVSCDSTSSRLLHWRQKRGQLSKGERIPVTYRQAHCHSDFWKAYQLVIPSEQHTAAGKETGWTAHVERWNNTLRQRLGRFVRKSLSFSKSEAMHEICLRLFLHDYNSLLALSLE